MNVDNWTIIPSQTCVPHTCISLSGDTMVSRYLNLIIISKINNYTLFQAHYYNNTLITCEIINKINKN